MGRLEVGNDEGCACRGPAAVDGGTIGCEFEAGTFKRRENTNIISIKLPSHLFTSVNNFSTLEGDTGKFRE